MTFCSFRHFGRMGNFLYEAACAYGFAKKHNLIFSINPFTRDPKWNPVYLLHLTHPDFVLQEDVLINELWTTEQHYNDYQYTDEMKGRNIIFNGYNQSYRYFDFCRNEMIKDFNFPYEFKEGVCSIHVRRGDYLLYPTKHPVVTMEYINNAIYYILKNTNTKKFIVFSDDISWCKENIKGENVTYSEGKNEVEDLILMSHCEHNICSNSTLALWGAELNQNPNKVVVVPGEDNWFGWENRAKMTVKDLYRPEWIKIPYQ